MFQILLFDIRSVNLERLFQKNYQSHFKRGSDLTSPKPLVPCTSVLDSEYIRNILWPSPFALTHRWFCKVRWRTRFENPL